MREMSTCAVAALAAVSAAALFAAAANPDLSAAVPILSEAPHAFALALGAVALGAPPRGGVLQTGRPLQEVLIHVGAVAGEEAGPIAGKPAGL